MLGTFGSGGAALVILVALIAHKRRGGGRLKLVREDHHVFYWCAGLSLFAANAGTALQQLGGIGGTLSHTVAAQSGSLGNVGPGAIAVIMLIVGFCFAPNFWKDSVCGLAAPGLLSAAGGWLAIPTTILASVLHSVVS